MTKRPFFSDRYFEQLLSESESQQPPVVPPMMQLPALQNHHPRPHHQQQQQQQQHEASLGSAFTAYAAAGPWLQEQQKHQHQQQEHEYQHQQQEHGYQHQEHERQHQEQQLKRPKRHQRPAHKEAELRRLFKIRESIQLLTSRCRSSSSSSQQQQQQQQQLAQHVSEAATLRECHEQMLAAELAVAAQRHEIDQLRRHLADSAMPAGQVIDYVQTKWLESPRFELFYKLVGKSLTDAFVSHMQAAAPAAAAPSVAGESSDPESPPAAAAFMGKSTTTAVVEKFPDQWLDRIRAQEIRRRSLRYFERLRRS